MRSIFQRSDKNPIITTRELPFHAEAVLNPGATEVDGKVVLLLRVEDTNGYSSIYTARSANGVTDWQVDKRPLLASGVPEHKYEYWGCEDPRITYIAEDEHWYITYTSYSKAGAAVSLASTKDFDSVKRIGVILPPNNKDACLFPERIEGRWALLQRPDAGGGIENIWLAYSPDMTHWGEPHCVMTEGSGPAWDAVRIGAGPPPIRTKSGWLMLYHGVKMYAGQMVYRVGAALLDMDKPHKIAARTSRCIFKASELYETTGLVPNIVFPTGILQRGEDLWVYYGSADTCICLAVVKIEDILNSLDEPAGHLE